MSVFMVTLPLVMTTRCNTAEKFGKDLSQIDSSIEKIAGEVKNNMSNSNG